MEKITTATIPMKTIKNQKKRKNCSRSMMPAMMMSNTALRGTELKKRKKTHGKGTRNTRDAAELIGLTTKKNMTLWSRGIPTLQKSSFLRRVVLVC